MGSPRNELWVLMYCGGYAASAFSASAACQTQCGLYNMPRARATISAWPLRIIDSACCGEVICPPHGRQTTGVAYFFSKVCLVARAGIDLLIHGIAATGHIDEIAAMGFQGFREFTRLFDIPGRSGNPVRC